MIYIHECRLCGRSSLAPAALQKMQICGDCFVNPCTDVIFQDSDKNGKDRNPC